MLAALAACAFSVCAPAPADAQLVSPADLMSVEWPEPDATISYTVLRVCGSRGEAPESGHFEVIAPMTSTWAIVLEELAALTSR